MRALIGCSLGYSWNLRDKVFRTEYLVADLLQVGDLVIANAYKDYSVIAKQISC